MCFDDSKRFLRHHQLYSGLIRTLIYDRHLFVLAGADLVSARSLARLKDTKTKTNDNKSNRINNFMVGVYVRCCCERPQQKPAKRIPSRNQFAKPVLAMGS